MFKERLTIVLQTKNISQVQLSKELGFTSAAINRWCKGITEPDNKTIVKIAKYLKVSTDYLLGNDLIISEKDEQELREMEILKKTLVNAGYMKDDEDLSKEELKKLMDFVKTNKKYIKEMK